MTRNFKSFDTFLHSEHYQHIMAFNFQPITYTEASWYADVIQESHFSRLTQHDPINSNHFLMNAFHLYKHFDFDFSDYCKRLFLIPKDALNTLIDRLGVMACSESLISIIDKKRVEIMIHAIGHKGYDFLLKKSHFLIQEKPHWLQQSIRIDASFHQQLKIHGFNIFYSLLQDYPAVFRQRCQMKFPKWLSDNFIPYVPNTSQDRTLAERLIHKIIKIEFPECLNLLK